MPTVSELITQCRARGIPYSKKRKAELEIALSLSVVGGKDDTSRDVENIQTRINQMELSLSKLDGKRKLRVDVDAFFIHLEATLRGQRKLLERLNPDYLENDAELIVNTASWRVAQKPKADASAKEVVDTAIRECLKVPVRIVYEQQKAIAALTQQ
jgi:hypothetical protein